MSGVSNSRLGAWSRRKVAVQAEAEALVADQKQAEIAERHKELAEKSEADALQELDLPLPENMKAGDDFSAFMKEAVPAALRNRALRKLWLSNPVLANVDNLVDYGDDFAAEAKLGGAIKTIYRVGKGMLQDEGEEDEQTEETIVAALDIEEPEQPEEANDEPVCEPVVLEAAIEPAEDLIIDAPFKRKMRFEFAEIGNE